MKTKITKFLFATALLISLNTLGDIGGPIMTPKPPTGSPLISMETNIRI